MLLVPSARTAKTATECGCEEQQTATVSAKLPLPTSGSAAGRSCGNSSRRRRGCGTRALLELLATAVLVQFAAIAGGGSWLLLRLNALEAQHEQMQESCGAGVVAAAPAHLPGNKHREALPTDGGTAAAYVDAVGDIMFGQKQRQGGDRWSHFAWKRSAGGDGSGAEGAAAATTASPVTEAAAAEQLADESGPYGMAHFVFRHPRDDEFQLDESLSRREGYTIMVPRPGDVPSKLINDRWYPRMLHYLAASGQLMFLAKAPWLHEWTADSTARANSFGEITVSQEGLYMIYAQVCFTNKVPQVMGFVIKKRTVPATGSGAERGGEGSGHIGHPRDEYIAACETYASGGAQPESALRRFTCPVTTMHRLTPRDRLSIELLSARHIFVRHDFTYIGLVRMA